MNLWNRIAWLERRVEELLLRIRNLESRVTALEQELARARRGA